MKEVHKTTKVIDATAAHQKAPETKREKKALTERKVDAERI